jgi:hypothetical protein
MFLLGFNIYKVFFNELKLIYLVQKHIRNSLHIQPTNI